MERLVSCHVHDGVARVTIERPESRNALSLEVIERLRTATDQVRRDDSARVLVLAGRGSDAFSAGGDLVEMGDEIDHLEAHTGRGALAELFQDLWSLGKPTLAAVRGYALAGGMGLALACDLVVAARGATFGTPEIKVGLWPYMITLPLLRSMPPKTALRLMMTGELVSAQEGHDLGFVTHVAEEDEHDQLVNALAERLAEAPPAAMQLGRDAFYRVVDRDVEQRLALLHASLTVNLGTREAAEGLAAFREKRSPRWTLR